MEARDEAEIRSGLRGKLVHDVVLARLGSVLLKCYLNWAMTVKKFNS
jgi:hypothetical protein